MENMRVTVVSARILNDEVHAWVRADSPPLARLHIELRLPAQEGRNPWETAYDEALRYLDPA